MALTNRKKVVLLVGGVGGAKLALGLQQIISPDDFTIIVNTGDDFWHYGLRICPDVDTLLYTLSGRVDKTQGWGAADDSTQAMNTLSSYGEDIWFKLGDKDLATHLLRTHLLRSGCTYTEIVARLADAMGVEARVLPMSDAPVATRVETAEHGELDFQEYFVRHRWQPTVKALRYDGAEQAVISAEVGQAIALADVILLGPSNPWLSIAPILAVNGMLEALIAQPVPRVAVTPIVEGRALKGPAAKLMSELGYEVSAQSVAEYYGKAINGFIYDERDTDFKSHGIRTTAFDTIMKTDADKAELAAKIMAWIDEWERV